MLDKEEVIGGLVAMDCWVDYVMKETSDQKVVAVDKEILVDWKDIISKSLAIICEYIGDKDIAKEVRQGFENAFVAIRSFSLADRAFTRPVDIPYGSTWTFSQNAKGMFLTNPKIGTINVSPNILESYFTKLSLLL